MMVECNHVHCLERDLSLLEALKLLLELSNLLLLKMKIYILI